MNKQKIKQHELKEKIFKIPPELINDVENFLENILKKTIKTKPERGSLEGIWRETKFAKMKNIEEEIKQIKKELDKSIIEKFNKKL